MAGEGFDVVAVAQQELTFGFEHLVFAGGGGGAVVVMGEQDFHFLHNGAGSCFMSFNYNSINSPSFNFNRLNILNVTICICF